MKPTHITDHDIARIMASTPHFLMLKFMQQYGESITDDSNYWNFLGTAWKAGGCFADQEQWINLFRSKRRNRQKIMKTSERRDFSRLPKIITAYRCCNDESEIEQSICWSLDQKFVADYANKTQRNIIVKQNFEKKDVFAYFNRRQESEILVWRGAA